jgi:hypothetical protein
MKQAGPDVFLADAACCTIEQHSLETFRPCREPGGDALLVLAINARKAVFIQSRA